MGFHWPFREKEMRHKAMKLFPIILTIATFVVLAFYSYYRFTQEENAFFRIINEDGTRTLILLLAGTIGWYFFLARKTDNRFSRFHWPLREEEMRHKEMKLFPIILTIAIFVVLAFYSYYTLTQEENAFLRIINEDGTHTLILLLAGTIGWHFFFTRKTDNRFTEFRWPFHEKEMRHKVMKPFLIILTIAAFVIIAFYSYYTFTQKENAFLRIINEEGTRTLILLLVGIIGWYFLLARTEAAQQSANAANENVKIAEQGLTVERLTRATEQLGRSNLSVRVGGILSLEQVAIVEKDEREVGKDERETITRILVSFIRTRAKKMFANIKLEKKEDLEAHRSKRLDIEAAVNALARIVSKLQMQGQFPGQFNEAKRYLCNLQDADLRGLRFAQTDLTEFDFTKVDFSGAWLMEADLKKAQMSDCILTRANLKGSCFIETDLTRAHLVDVELTGADFTKANLYAANIDAVNIGITLPSRANFREANLNEANIRNINLSNSDFSEAKLRGSDIIDVDLSNANFSKAKLGGADIIDTDMSNVDFSEAELKRTDFRDTILDSAILDGVNIQGASLKNTDLSNAFFYNIKGLTQEQLDEAYYCDGRPPIELPDELELPPEKITDTIEDE